MIISSTIICYSNYDGGIVNAEKLNIVEVIIDGIDDEPKSRIIGSCGPFRKAIELWHYSGGYWKYNNLVIRDEGLGKGLVKEEELEKQLMKRLRLNMLLTRNFIKG